jgi:methyl-accepting chemotaxis protein
MFVKNLKLGVKLVGGFILTALIILAVGITAMYEQARLTDIQKELGEDDLPAVEKIITIKSIGAEIGANMRTLLTPYASVKQRKAAHEGLMEGRKIYGKIREGLLALPFAGTVKPELDQVDAHIVKWDNVNREAEEMSNRLIKLDMTNPTELNGLMKDFEIAHQSLLAKVGKLVAFNDSFEGGTDSRTCSLGRWMGNMNTTNPEITKLVSRLRPIHDRLHQHVGTIKRNIAEGNLEQARAITREELFPDSEKVFAIVGQMKAVSDDAYHTFQEMNRMLLTDAAVHQKDTFAAIDTIVKKVEEESSQTVRRGESIARTSRIITITGICIGVALAVVLGLVLTYLIITPLKKGVELSQAMAEGDMTRTLEVNQKDEIGILSESLNNMATNLRRMISDVQAGVENVDDSSTQLATISDQLKTGAENTSSKSAQVATAAEEMSANQNTVAAAMEQAAVNVNMVAAATDEMNSTITEIATNSHNAKEITTDAVNKSQVASQRVDELGAAANEINKVTEVITEISEQTNLLALNATIEAARAGEAGKGFAVVANEIKDLARQTASATMDIKNQIEGIQQATGITVTEINEIQNVISDIDQIVSTIAAAIEEQTATTREISDNVSQASTGISEVNENVAQSSSVAGEIASDIAEVNANANEMNEASSQVKDSATDLSGVAGNLKAMISKFTV